MNQEFFAGRFTAKTNSDCKLLVIDGPGNFGLHAVIDFDDVDHGLTEEQTRKLIELLDKYWPAEEVKIAHAH